MGEEEINFDDWSSVELYDYLKTLQEIDEESEVEDWDRISLLEIAKDLNL